MEELLMVLYFDFMNTKDGDDSEGARALDRKWDSLDPLFDEMEKKLSREEFTRVYNVICDTAAQIQTAAFSAGFFYCMKHLIKGGVDFFPHNRDRRPDFPGLSKMKGNAAYEPGNGAANTRSRRHKGDIKKKSVKITAERCRKENIRLKIALAASVAVNIALAIAVRNK